MKFQGLFIFVLLGSLMFSCSSNPYSKTNKIYKKRAKEYGKELSEFTPKKNKKSDTLNYGEYAVGTTNFNLRKPNYVVIHHTAQDSIQQTLSTFTLQRTQVSAHYVISKDGEIYQMLNDYFRGWHGGVGMWGNNTDLNSSSIGIELDNNGFEEFSEAQIESLLEVLKQLKDKYNIPAKNFIGHSDIAPGRKVDPNANFPWEKLAEEGYGLWYDKDKIENLKMASEFFLPSIKGFELQPDLTSLPFLDKYIFPEVVPADFDYALALRLIGYDISDLPAAVKAFKLHFIQENYEDPYLNNQDLKILYNLYKKFL
ncbi:N-acetylmuramoyl-L-alanine amidase [Christiangramia sp.]|uniref:N-acetylmuramoyl-L-alanine amidase n=1 Tax=Christiangramia sp. TaxID=1931228 RepID=UPI0026216710|nr:N-acetylmuramoyl-L-alanine amidase [Christiangramia sp.]